ncbi:unnamed protein product [Paramecium primaurelia]|uniref:WD40-repeat-containing domain n=1 Tax=Paramecium primaurelia TaxID=5886 RepID=A0A8S1PTQ8_PARPR|nr:unnamed protein product [Paramecium primaurelia]
MQLQQNQIQQEEFCYELQPQFTINQKEQCNAIAFNQNKQLLLVAYDKNIKVYQFNNGLLILIQIIPKNRYNITILNFFSYNKYTQFISGSCDSVIIIRSITQLRNQKYIQKLNSHQRGICCLVIGQDQNMFLSGSVDQTIKLWSCFQQQQISCQWSCQQTIIDHTNDVYALDINQQQTKAISCGYDDTMLIMDIVKYMQIYKLILKQKIKLSNFGYRILFLNDQDFIFQSYNAKFLSLFQLNQNQQYVITQQLPVQSLSQQCNIFFQPQLIRSKGFFACKNSQNLNFIRFNSISNELELLHSIKLDNYQQYGQLSEDGEYLITWDEKLEQLQIRKYKTIHMQIN